MITLPEFEEERMALMAEEHDILVDLVDHMHALSSRIDRLETTYKALAIEEKAARARPEATPTEEIETQPATSRGMTAALSLLGASLVWVVLLTGLDRYLASNEVMVFSSYPAEIPVWGLGAGTWVMFVLNQIGKTAPFFARVQTHVDSNRPGGWHHHGDGTPAVQRHHLHHVERVDVGDRCGRRCVGFIKSGGECMEHDSQRAHAQGRDRDHRLTASSSLSRSRVMFF